jgi:hypothetical protein
MYGVKASADGSTGFLLERSGDQALVSLMYPENSAATLEYLMLRAI